MRKRVGRLILLLPLISLGASAGEIKGVVRDSKTKAPVATATVLVKSSVLPDGSFTMTEENGSYRLPNLPAGTYTVTVNYAGAVSEQTVMVAAEGSVDVPLMVGASEAQAATYVITGTRIRSVNSQAVSPVASISDTEIRNTGSTRAEDVVNSLPQAFAAQGSTVSNGSNGTATANLRGLGSPRTLVLIDGRRLGPGNPNSFAGTPVVGDLNFIPTSLVERIDVLTGGSSAVYGADAVAGVVNFITKTTFEGVQLDLDWGVYGHHQQRTDLQQIIRDTRASVAPANQQFYNVPPDVWNIQGPSVSLTLGANSRDGKGNVTAYASYRKDYPILEADRDFSSCSFNSGDPTNPNSAGTDFTCGGSGTSSPARVGGFVVQGNTFRTRNPATDLYNFGPLNYFQRPDERYNLGAFAHYKLASWADVYSQAMYLDDRSIAQIAPGGIFASTRTINCANPLMTDAQAAQLGCAADRSGVFTGTVAKRNVEGGGRQDSLHHSSYRYVMGLRGDITPDWNYDAYMQYMATDFANSAQNYFHSTRVNNALNVVTDTRAGSPTLGQPVCQSVIDGTDPACVPYNIFTEGAIQPGDPALTYLQVPGYEGGYGSERVVDLNIAGNLGNYGIRSPFACDGVAVSAGGEWRRQAVSYYSDFLLQANLLSGRGGASPSIDRSFDVLEAFTEARFPLVQKLPAVYNLQVEGAYRYSNYSFGKDTHTFKAGGEWEFLEDMRVRGSFQRAVRAPSISELYAPQNVVLDGATDPCAGLAAGDPLIATCAGIAWGPNGTRYTPAQIQAIEPDPANQYSGQLGGNTRLDPELSDTFSVGFVAQPTFLRGLQVSVDYFNIKIDKAILPIGADLILRKCLAGDQTYCALVNRGAQGSIRGPDFDGGYVIDINQNLAAYATSGLDVNFSYTQAFSGMGSVTLGMNSTYLIALTTQVLPTEPTYDCAGLYGTVCGAPAPQWRHKMRLTWDTPVGLSLSAQWRFVSTVGLDAATTQPSLANAALNEATDLFLGSRNYLDLVATYTVADIFTFRAGVNNVIDTDPPIVGQDNLTINAGGNGNTIPQAYDALGRYIFLSASAHF